MDRLQELRKARSEAAERRDAALAGAWAVVRESATAVLGPKAFDLPREAPPGPATLAGKVDEIARRVPKAQREGWQGTGRAAAPPSSGSIGLDQPKPLGV